MAILNFPPTAGEPIDGSFTYSSDGVTYSWDGYKWTADTGSGGGGGDANHNDGPTPPTTGELADQWYNTDDGRLYTYTADSSGTLVWIDASPDSIAGGSGGSGDGTTVNYNGASAWGNVESDGTVKGSFNASVQRTSTGRYFVTFAQPVANSNYSVTATCSSTRYNASYVQNKLDTTGFEISVKDDNDSNVDFDFCFAVHAENAIAPPSGVGADAWGRFNTQGTLKGSFNCSVVASSNTYTVTFNVPMPSENYAVVANTYKDQGEVKIDNQTASSFRIVTYDSEGVPLAQGAHFTVHASSTVTPTYTWTRDGTTLKTANDGDDVTVRGAFRSGAADDNVAVIGTSGIVAAYRSDATSKACFQTFVATSPSTPTSQIFSDGSATFAGLIRSIGTYNNTSSGSNDLGVSSGGAFYRSTSSGRFKSGVETMEPRYADAILNCRPVYYHSTCAMDDPSLTYWGFIAEEVGEIDPRLVKWSELEDGTKQAESVAYDRFVPHLVNLIQRQNTRIETLEETNASLEARLTALEGGNN